MKLSNFDYHLPEELIAQHPVEPRDSSRLMVVNRKTKTFEHRIFRDIVEYLYPKDLLVLNNTRVIPARLFAFKNNAKIEVFLVEKVKTSLWKCMVKPGKKVKVGDILDFEGFQGKCIDRLPDGLRLIEFNANDDEILSHGHTPLPPYVKTNVEMERYQTVYAKYNGSVAAPTAGLHFTESLLENIKSKGVKVVELTLHVSVGTFRPVKTEDITKHTIYPEYYSIPDEVVQEINNTKLNGGRVIAVGTTVVRALETYALTKQTAGKTDLFIYPPFEFKIVDCLVTNFHLPKSTLLMLVVAFAGYDLIMNAYQEAIKLRYRFYSFGDAMLII
ncbi:tRNA preQ1(34) S-adenosylmethionine ribosyltransferase-isomerase QueA [Pseudothermotoga thermarum]|uniref:S-adenosylmethionine:tRNA ribosyltransferase-isomerase n=1 Tax=Pseudothermotoga thermarum DSM 5069 TaxID=688269 RepID=F7YYW1_9THEM|nr:tRNA preQ1(34) S-adenosylmethionine ribosyltransferase-isomerase QueA [Pseudothermotoga thermarum]AEH51155.1 S-adenosylmethionine--tRNA ribosyltransferase-isomerase [Pseudothermotoga thermarum DSM 5069]